MPGRAIIALLAALLLVTVANLPHPLARGGGAAPACSASPPAQASAAGLTKLVFCDTLATLQSLDRQNSKSAWFKWFVANQADSVQVTNITNDGTGYTAYCCNISSSAPAANAQGYVGGPFSGDFYYEAEMQFDPSVYTGSETVFPAVWSPDLLWITQYSSLRALPFNGIELDCVEMLPHSGGVTMQFTVWDETDYPVSGLYYGVSQSLGTFGGGSSAHTYGCLWQRAANHGGTGTVKFYYDNTLQATLTYSSGSPSPVCNAGTEGCGAGAFMDLDGASVFLRLQGCHQSYCPTTYRNAHVWQAP